ncbi:MAG: hypothetical protein M3O84_02355 [Actinomycetota bacterium]|nr:hypothetical protein [Actinomycetota bacterium]
MSRSTVESEAVLRDGTTVFIRQAVPGDRHRVEDYLIGLSPESRRLRFGSASISVSEVAERAVDDAPDHVALLALHGGPEGDSSPVHSTSAPVVPVRRSASALRMPSRGRGSAPS